jgi:hypothetical protein
MRRRIMSDREGYRRVRSRNAVNWGMLLLVILGGIVLCGFCVVGLRYVKDRAQEDRERNWASAVATVEDVRWRPAMRVESNRGGEMLYDVDVLVKYSAGEKPEERWVKVEQTPKGLGAVRFEAFRWKGKECFVRWKAEKPDEVVAEVN